MMRHTNKRGSRVTDTSEEPMPMNYLLIDALEYSRPSRRRFEEWREGGLACVHVTLAIWENARATLSVLSSWHDLLRVNGDLIGLALDVEDIDRISASGRTAVVFGFQNTTPFEDELGLVRIFHDLGVRIAQLTYNVQNNVASGCWEENDAGLSSLYGRNLVREMNDVGMLIDLSHCGERSCLETIDYSERSVAITHGNPAEFVGDDIELRGRTRSTVVLKNLAARGGVVGLSPYPRMAPGGSGVTLDWFLDMICWTVELLGIDHVGFGTDYYTDYPDEIVKWWRAGRWARESPIPITGGLVEWPDWFSSPAQFPTILEGLEHRGFSHAEVAKLAGGNWRRLFDASFSPIASEVVGAVDAG